MRKPLLLLATVLLVSLASGGVARAEYGAIAYDQGSGRYGFAWNKGTQRQATDTAMKDCGSDKCKLIPVPGGKCGALATSADEKESNAWGVSIRERKPDAELAAIQNCQKRTSGQCKIKGSECNR
jgi:hypothetical protein